MIEAMAYTILLVVVVASVVVGAKVLIEMVFEEMRVTRERDVGLNSEIIGAIAGTIESAMVSTMQKTIRAFLGEPDVSVQQPTTTPLSDLNAPDWTTWDDDVDDNDPGVGDSIFFDRENRGTAMINEMDVVIPGVSFPDTTGERF
jgi:hypothetical protein